MPSDRTDRASVSSSPRAASRAPLKPCAFSGIDIRSSVIWSAHRASLRLRCRGAASLPAATKHLSRRSVRTWETRSGTALCRQVNEAAAPDRGSGTASAIILALDVRPGCSVVSAVPAKERAELSVA